MDTKVPSASLTKSWVLFAGKIANILYLPVSLLLREPTSTQLIHTRLNEIHWLVSNQWIVFRPTDKGTTLGYGPKSPPPVSPVASAAAVAPAAAVVLTPAAAAAPVALVTVALVTIALVAVVSVVVLVAVVAIVVVLVVTLTVALVAVVS